MNRIHTLSLALVTLFSAALLPACVAEPVDSEDAEDMAGEEVGVAQQGLTYVLDPAVTYVTWADGEAVTTASVRQCTQFTNGVVRGWQLKMKNLRDFRYSREWCREMLSDGSLGSNPDPWDHFYYDGDGSSGISQIPLDKLPIGVQLQTDKLGIGALAVWKVADAALMYASVTQVRDHAYTWAYALGALGTSGSYAQLKCPVGSVMTGIGVKHMQVGSGDTAEIRGVSIACHALVQQ